MTCFESNLTSGLDGDQFDDTDIVEPEIMQPQRYKVRLGAKNRNIVSINDRRVDNYNLSVSSSEQSP